MESDTINTVALIHTCSTREAKYLLEHIVNMAIESVSIIWPHPVTTPSYFCIGYSGFTERY